MTDQLYKIEWWEVSAFVTCLCGEEHVVMDEPVVCSCGRTYEILARMKVTEPDKVKTE